MIDYGEPERFKMGKPDPQFLNDPRLSPNDIAALAFLLWLPSTWRPNPTQLRAALRCTEGETNQSMAALCEYRYCHHTTEQARDCYDIYADPRRHPEHSSAPH
jgi:hypothetical protein